MSTGILVTKLINNRIRFEQVTITKEIPPHYLQVKIDGDSRKYIVEAKDVRNIREQKKRKVTP